MNLLTSAFWKFFIRRFHVLNLFMERQIGHLRNVQIYKFGPDHYCSMSFDLYGMKPLHNCQFQLIYDISD